MHARTTSGDTAFSLIGGSGEKAFTDETLPLGIGGERAGLKFADGGSGTTAKLAA